MRSGADGQHAEAARHGSCVSDEDDDQPKRLRLKHLDKEPEGEPQGRRVKYLDANHDRYKRSKVHEERLAKDLGGRRLPNSGGKIRSKHAKTMKVSDISFRGELHKEGFERITLDGDIGSKDFHYEHKRTDNLSIAVKREWWEKVADGARSTNTEPALVLTFETPGRLGSIPLDLVVVSKAVFERLKGGPKNGK